MKVFDLYAERYDLWYDLPFGSSVFALEVECLKRCGPVEGPSLEVGVGSGRFKEAGAKDIRISFIDSYIFIAIDFRKDLLEPSLFSAIDYNRMWITYWRVKAFYDVVDDLNLNRRIWGKT